MKKGNLSVEMNRRGVSAIFTITKDEDQNLTWDYYKFLAGRRTLQVSKNSQVIIDENDVGDPMNPTNAERAVISMARDFEGFDECLYDLGCGLAILFNNDASDDYAKEWLSQQIEEALSNAD